MTTGSGSGILVLDYWCVRRVLQTSRSVGNLLMTAGLCAHRWCLDGAQPVQPCYPPAAALLLPSCCCPAETHLTPRPAGG